MLNYNDNNIFVGYIKQLLSSFNYPDLIIYKEGLPLIKDALYLKDNKVIRCNGSSLEESEVVDTYSENRIIPNITRSFKNNSFIYDTHTHVWLGRYLRYLRDYRKLNLMSLYNCFTDELARELSKTIYNLGFDLEDNNYKIYSIPIELFNTYSIYVACDNKVEIVCTLNTNDTHEDDIAGETYKRVYNSSFNNPIIFEAPSNPANIGYYYKNKHNLRLLLKVPANNKSSIVILEGTYSGCNDFIFSNKIIPGEESGDEARYIQKDLQMKYNYSVTNYEYINEGKLNNNLKSPLELTYLNTGINHPFSDRLIEYLTGNTITPIDDIADNIKRIERKLAERYSDGEIGIKSYTESYGIWIPKMRNVIYDIAVSNNNLGETRDILGYVDKDVEKQLGADFDIYSRNGGSDL